MSDEDWTLEMKSFSFGSSSRIKMNVKTAKMDVLIASATTMSYIPEKHWDNWLNGIGKKDDWSFDDDAGYFWVKCSGTSMFNGFWIDFDDSSLYIASENFIQYDKDNGECWLFADYSDDDYMIMGSSFLRGNYLTFDVENKKVGFSLTKARNG